MGYPQVIDEDKVSLLPRENDSMSPQCIANMQDVSAGDFRAIGECAVVRIIDCSFSSASAKHLGKANQPGEKILLMDPEFVRP